MADTRELNLLVKFLSPHEKVKHYFEAVSKFFSDLKCDKFTYTIEIGKVKTSLNEFNYEELKEMIIKIICSDVKNDHHFVYFANYIQKMWCKESEINRSLEWLMLDNSYVRSTSLITEGSLRVNEIAFGTFPGMNEYVQRMKFRQVQKSSNIISSISCKFNHLQKEVILYVSNRHKSPCQNSEDMGYKIIFSYDSVIRIVANTNSELDTAELFFHLEYPPFIYINLSETLTEDDEVRNRVTKAKEMEDGFGKFERTFQMGCQCNKTLWLSKGIGKNLVLKLIVEDKFQFRWNLEQMSLRCSINTEICFSYVKIHILTKKDQANFRYLPNYIRKELSALDAFNCDYAWNVVMSRSDVVLHQMSLKILESAIYSKNLHNIICSFIKSNISAFLKSLYCIANMIDKGLIFNFLTVLKIKFTYFCNFVELNVLPKGMSYVRRVIVTPSRGIFLQPYEHFDNRIIRKFGPEFMLRVSFQDDNFSKLTYAVQYNSKKEELVKNIVGHVLLNGITIGSRKYELLAASTSQLRDHGIWFYAKDFSGNTASSIQEWMGDFSSIKNVAKFMARMGQCLTSTETGVQIFINAEDEWDLKDVKNKNYIFSDGIGIISSDLAEEVRQTLLQMSNSSNDEVLKKNAYKPVAFQIRYKGCKGMVVEYPMPGRKLGIRPSMKKFECTTSNQLEIVKTSSPTKLYLNKHLITILEQMGVPKEEFIKLELKMILNLLNSLISENILASSLTENLPLFFSFHDLQKAGFGLTSDPFFRSLALAYFKCFAEKLKDNMRIAVPDQFGRNMLGVLDETNTLKYGQVFVQYSKSLNDPNAGFEILEGPVLVTRNPSLHPGDVRKLIAVNVPQLQHIKDCIVFPAKGKRPHPDEMAGSDLDGDEMVVLWYKPLIFSRKSANPMNYPVYEETCTNQSIQLADIAEFFCQYIQNDNIGTFANAHLVWADTLKNGIFSKKCMDIAQRYPYVLDFAKHGTTEYLKKSERPYNYPDYMQKGVRGNTYHSHKTLGTLYRISRVLNSSSSKIELNCRSTGVYDPDLEYPGWEKYANSAEAHRKEYTAKILEVLDRYCLSSEAEAFFGFIETRATKTWRQERSNTIKIVKRYLSNIMEHYRNLFLSEVKEECSDLTTEESSERKYQRASAWYMVVYSNETERVLSFPWTLGNILADIKRKRVKNVDLLLSNCYYFFRELDDDINQWYKANDIVKDQTKCLCNELLQIISLKWISSSGLNIGNSDKSVCCSSCYERILNFYKLESKIYCCYGLEKSLCHCDKSCSPAKHLADFLKFYIANAKVSGKCDKDSCEGFLPKNLQELALQTYSYLAITRNIHYLGLQFNSKNFTKYAISSYASEFMFEEEGTPIKIPVDPVFKELIEKHGDDIEKYLKKTSGVSKITLTPGNHMCLIVNSVGKNWQRWNLEEILLDTNFTENLKKYLNV